jgi:translation initiation factor IF-1
MPDKVSEYSHHSVYWLCPNGHEYKTTPGHRSKGTNCPLCARKKASIGINDLATKNPKLAAEWHPTLNGKLKPTDVSYGSNKKVWWQCKHGHSWEASVSDRHKGNGCPYCSGRKAIPGINDLASRYPNIAKEWHPSLNRKLQPNEVTYGSGEKVWWLCPNGHEYFADIHNRTNGRGCPFCSGHKVLLGYNDLNTCYPDIAKEWHSTKNGHLTPDQFTSNSGAKIWWQCSNDLSHEWQSSIANRVKGKGCPICKNKKLLVGYNDLATTHPQLAKEWHPTLNGDLKPTDVIAGTHQKVYWQCKNGHEWMAAINSRRGKKARGCPYCAGQRLIVGFNDLETLYPDIAKEWHPTKNGTLRPFDVMPGNRNKVYWLCPDGHEYEAVIGNRARKNMSSGCPICNESRGEKAVRDILTKFNIDFKEQNIFPDRISSFGGLLKDDFAILHKDKVVATIEYHGIQHYEVTDFTGHDFERAKDNFDKGKIRDREKTKYLNEHNIPQLIIPYWEYDNISTLIQEFLSTI